MIMEDYSEFPYTCRLFLEHFFWMPTQSYRYQQAKYWCESRFSMHDHAWIMHSATYVEVKFKHHDHAVEFALTWCTS